MKLKMLAAVGLVSVALVGCEGGEHGTKETFGTLLGGVGGAVAGAQFGKGSGQVAAAAAGALLGAFLGNEVGKSLDRADRIHMARTTAQTLEMQPSGTTTSWRNPDSGNSGSITPQPAFQNATGQYCREFQQTVTVGGQTESAYGTACRQPDGSWRIVNG